MTQAALTPEQILARVPQQRPFRFVDRLLELTEARAVGEYTFRPDEFFYAGHFPGNPVTPGVILLESMCQIGVVALGLHLLALEAPDELATMVSLFTSAQVEFESVVRPGETVRVEADKLYWRFRKLKAQVKLSRVLASGALELVAHGAIAGMAVSPNKR